VLTSAERVDPHYKTEVVQLTATTAAACVPGRPCQLSFNTAGCHLSTQADCVLYPFQPLQDTLKLSYDIKSEAAAAEWNRKPYKVSDLTVTRSPDPARHRQC
jgi:hypothetical protein